MKFARSNRMEVEVNLTPLIDVVFLLLIFFMVSTTFTKETHLVLDLPEAAGQAGPVENTQIEIVVSKGGAYTINDEVLVDNRLDTLKRAIEAISQGDNSLPVVVTADASSSHQSVVRAMDAAGQLGFVHLNITTRNVSED